MEPDETLRAQLNDSLAENAQLKEERAILRAALAEAGEFCVKRIPKDAADCNTSEYFQMRFIESAKETLRHAQGV